ARRTAPRRASGSDSAERVSRAPRHRGSSPPATMAYHVGCQRREPRSHADHARDDSASPVRKLRHGRDPDLAEEAAMTGATYDLVIRGGRVIDPAQGLDGALDVPVRDGRVAAVGARLSP